MRLDLDAATSSSTDVVEAQWRSGVNRQAQPDAAAHQCAASQAAASKRSADAARSEDEQQAFDERQRERDAARKRRQYDYVPGEDEGDPGWESRFAEWLGDEEAQERAWEREQERAAALEVQRSRETAEGAAVEWALEPPEEVYTSMEADPSPPTWELRTREELAGRRHLYLDFKPCTGSMDAARVHAPHLVEARRQVQLESWAFGTGQSARSCRVRELVYELLEEGGRDSWEEAWEEAEGLVSPDEPVPEAVQAAMEWLKQQRKTMRREEGR